MKLIDLKPGRSLFELTVEKKHIQPWGVAHGGVLASILDAAAFWAVHSLTEDGVSMTTVDLQIKYLAPIKLGQRLEVRGRAINLGRTLGLGQAEAVETETGKLAGFAASSVMVLDGALPGALGRLPKKFVA